MNTTRRNVLLTTLFGAGAVGLRALATGIPAGVLLDPRKAYAASCATPSPQFVIFTTSGDGDPINANCPGAYGVPAGPKGPVFNCPSTNPMYLGDPAYDMTPTMMQVGSRSYQAAKPWTTMASYDPTRTQFWHMMTDTPVHPKEPDVLGLMSSISPAEMFPSFLSKNLATCLGTIQPQPVSVGAATPTEALTFNGAPLPVIPPSALVDTLVSNPRSPFNRNKLQSLRDSTLGALDDIYLDHGASPAQRAFVDSYVNSQTELRHLSASLLNSLSDLSKSPHPQVDAAIALIRMNVTPVVAIHIPFGGDNHHDVNYTDEARQTVAGCATLGYLLSQLASFGLQDRVTIVSLNVFGRTLAYNQSTGDGRQHNPNHHVSFVIGKPFKGGVIGGIRPVGSDYGALPIDSTTGAGAASGDVKPIDTLAAWGMTIAQGVGVDPTIISSQMKPTNNPANEGTAKVIPAALA